MTFLMSGKIIFLHEEIVKKVMMVYINVISGVPGYAQQDNSAKDS